jgi:hypothetical protein
LSADLKDFRGKITALAWCYLEAEHRATGEDQSEIVREILHSWAERKHDAAIEARKLMEAEGIAGNDREGEGRQRK